MTGPSLHTDGFRTGALARVRRALFPHHRNRVLHPSASFSATMRVRLENRPGAFAALAEAIGDAGGLLGAIDLVRVGRGHKTRDVTFLASDAAHVEHILEAVRHVPGIEVEHVSDRTFLAHLGGKLEVTPRTPLKTRDDLSIAYTPGVGRVSSAIAADPTKVWSLTIKQNTVAVVSDGTAVLGLGDIGPEGALPVMEGKAVLFKEFAGVDAWPVCLATKDVDEIVRTVTAIAPVFGGINLEDISAPRCFEIERRLRETLDIPVFHDDQHGTAIVVLASLLNALRVVGKELEDVRIVMTGVGASGTAVTKTLLAAGARDIVGCDRQGALYRNRPGLTPAKTEYAELTNPHDLRCSPDEALAGADVYIGLSSPGAVSASSIRRMADRAIVFAMANPVPEVMPEEIEGDVEVVATGRSDYPNQINNVLAFPGVFRGALDVRAREITSEMEVAAAHAIAAVVKPEELEADYIVPSVFNKEVAPAVAGAVAEAAERSGVARRSRGPRETDPSELSVA
ncbi:MAG TPA: NAD-dependent malic enzyme [Gaiellaceae bacterium]|nr:NAD-dependent malic enzyme [Gaiellaceae bacterium]